MCLKTNNPQKIAERDIRCYKVLRQLQVGNELVPATPFMETVIEEDVLRGKKPLEAKSESHKDAILRRETGTVQSGYIHTYEGKTEAITAIGELLPEKSVFYVCECVIPEGTPMFEGVTPLPEYVSFASKRIVIKKVERYMKQPSSFFRGSRPVYVYLDTV